MEILKSLSPQELINQFSAVLPSLNISVEDFDKQSIQIRSKHTSKNLFYLFIYLDILVDKMKAACNSISSISDLQYEALLDFLVPKFCVKDM